MASLRPNFRKKQQPTQILELNAGYYIQSAADKMRICNEVHRQDPRQSLFVHSEQTSLLQQDIKPVGERERKKERRKGRKKEGRKERKKERKAHSLFKTNF